MRSHRPQILPLAFVAVSVFAPCAHAAWAPTGNPLCNISGFQYPTQVRPSWFPTGFASPPMRGMVVVWQDQRADEGDVYVGVVSDYPPPDPAPGADGSPVAVAAGNQAAPIVTTTGYIPNGAQVQGPAIVVAWIDAPTQMLRARRLWDPVDWGPLGIAVPGPAGFAPSSAALTDDGGTGVVMAWLTNNLAQRLVRAQRLDAQGNLLWGAEGVPVGEDTTVQAGPVVANGPDGGLYVLRTDHRSAGTLGGQQALVLYRLDGSGATAAGWPAAGVVLGGALPHAYRLRADGAGGVFAAWREQEPLSDLSTGIETRVTRIGQDGAPVGGWSLAGTSVVDRPDGNRLLDDVDGDGTDGIVLVVEYDRVAGGPSPTGTDLVVQRLLGDGTRPAGWPAAGITLCAAAGSQREASVIDLGGASLAAWRDERSGESDLFCLRLEPDGSVSPGWDAQGLLLSGAASTQSAVRLAPNIAGGALFVWHDWRNGATTGADLFIQTVNSLGQLDAPRPVVRSSALSPPVPSPARSSVELAWTDPSGGEARIEVLDASGRRVRAWREAIGAGTTRVRWDLRDDTRRRVAPGVYRMRVSTAHAQASRPIVVAR